MGLGQQIKYLLYRNFLLKRRNSKQTIYEAVSVLYFVAILAVLRKFAIKPTTLPPIKDGDIETFPIFEPKTGLWTNFSWLFVSPPKTIGYVFLPGSDANEANLVIKKVENYTQGYRIKFAKYQNEKALDDAHKANSKNVSMGLVIDINAQKKVVNYTIKVTFGTVPLSVTSKRETATTADAKCRGKKWAFYRSKGQCPVNTYFSSWFSVIQSLTDNAIIEVFANETGFLPPQIKAKMFPKGEYKTPLSYFKTIISIYMVMAFSPYIMFLLTFVVNEKEKKIKEAMKIMGLSQFAFWVTWFITYAIIITFGVILVVIIARLALLFGNSDYFLIFIIFFLYGLSIETLAFSLTPLFQKARSAGMFGSVCTILLSCLSMLHIYLKTSNGVKWLTSFLSPVALSLALVPAVESDEGITWSTAGTKGDFPASYGIAMLFIDTILYLLLALYLDSVFPGEYGQRKHPLFCFRGSFWKNLSGKNERKPSFFRGHSVKEDEANVDVEEMPLEILDKLVISVRKLKKTFRRGKEELKALDGVSLDVYEGQITALLGHNGAGKSTLIAALTGMLPVSGGRATVYGKSIRNPEDMDRIRQLIGLCPQQNIIFDELTPREHLKIFAGIKGIETSSIDRLTNETLKEIDLWDKADSISKNLSGGQKRKLCVGIALIGDPKVLFLDEPTSGMDPSSRRYIWSLLQQKKEDRVIFLTTHFMDEADILADQKAVLVKGKLRCAGSSLFLKSRFGVGYNLSMVVEEDCDRSKISDMVSQIVPGGTVSRSYSKEFAFRLPMKSVATFSDLFAALEKENNTSEPCCAPMIGVSSYGVSMTTLEEVFLKVDEEQDHANGEVNQGIDDQTENLIGGNNGNNSANNVNMNEIEGIAQEGSIALFWLQLTSLLELRFWSSIRSPMKIIFQIVIPVALLIAGLIIMRSSTAKAPEGVVQTVAMEPSVYLQQGSVSIKDNTKALIQNDSHGSLNDVLYAFQNEQIKYSMVNSVASAPKPRDLGFEIEAYNSVKGQVNYLLRYNDASFYSIPVGISTMSNTALRIALNKSGKSFNGGRLNAILTNSKPFESVETPWSYDNTVFSSILLIGLTFAFIPTGFSIEVVRYREIGFRHQLRVCGVNRWIYWLQFFIGDIILYIFPVVIVYILIPAFDLKAFNNPAALGALFLLFLLYNVVNLLFSYVFSFGFNKWETLQNVSGTVLIMASLIPYVAVSIVDMASGSAKPSTVAMILHIVFCALIPPYEIMGGLYFIHRIWRLEATIAQNNDVKIPASKYFELSLENGLPITLIILTLQVFLYSYFLAVLDLWKAGGVIKFPLSLCKSRRVGVNPSHILLDEKEKDMNDDVKAEIEKVRNICRQGNVKDRSVLVEGITKDFGSKKNRKRVVDDVYLDVAHGEILGLLGPNGAGKTTTMNMITADFPANAGEVYLGGHNIKTELSDALQQLGYCPQSDVVIENITLEEHLKCFSLIKGVPRESVKSVVHKYMAAMKITEHAETRAGSLSGGTKRKLCFLVSMCGSPGIVLMDEPSTGMDPASKRFLWTIASKNITGERGAILTTHSMEEADALCSRVGIIVKGQLKCIGTTQELKSTYGGGYSLELKGCIDNDISVEDRMDRIDRFVHEMFSDAEEAERFGYRVIYKIPKESVGNLSDVFGSFEKGKSTLGIEEYSFSQATLEQVFLEFAKWQDEDLVDKECNGTEEMRHVAAV